MAIFKRRSKKYKGGYSYTVQIKYRDNFGITQRYCKSGFRTRNDAEAEERKIKDQLDCSGSVKKQVEMTLNSLVDEYLNTEQPSMKMNTYTAYKRVYDHHARDTIGRSLIKRLQYKDFKELFNDLGDKLGKTALTQMKAVLSNAYVYGIQNEYIQPVNPIQYIKITKYKKKTKKKNQFLTDGQFMQMIDYCETSGRDIANSYRIALYIAYYTGMRRGEILALTKSDIDLISNKIQITKQLIRGEHTKDFFVQDSPKTDTSEGNVPIAKPLKEILIDWMQENPYEVLIPNKTGEYMNPDNFTGFCGHMSIILGFHINPHMLRHTFTTNLIDNGIAPEIVQKLDRHASIATTMNIYNEVRKDKQAAALDDVFSERLEEKYIKSTSFSKS